MKKRIVFLLLSMMPSLLLAAPIDMSDGGLVYTRQPRHQTFIPASGPNQWDIDDASNWQHNNDIGRLWRQSETDLVIDNLKGDIRIIHNCTSVPAICAAKEGRVSPDGTKIIYSVGIAPLNATKWPVKAANGPYTQLWDFDSTGWELWLYDIATEKKTRLTVGGRNRMPEWAANDVVVFMSTRSGIHTPKQTQNRQFYGGRALQMFRAKLVGETLTEITNISPEVWHAMSPEVTTTGQVCMSAFEGIAPREFGSTPQNVWWVNCRDINGRNAHSEVGAHGSPTLKTTDYMNGIVDPMRRGEGAALLRGIRMVSELYPSYLSLSSYYRSNSGGANGVVAGWTSDFAESEGCLKTVNMPGVYKWGDKNISGSGHYLPCDFTILTPWGQDQDLDNPKFHINGMAMGRAGYSFALPGNDYGITQSLGWCYEAVPPLKATYGAMGGQVPCKRQITRSKVLQSTDPFNPDHLECMAACELEWHAWDAQWVGTYRGLFGIDTPAIAEIKPPETVCELRVVDVRANELWPLPGKTDQKNRVAFQGNADPDFADKVTHFGVEHFEHWNKNPTYEGPMSVIETRKAPVLADGSIKLIVQCGVPFQHFGFDADGNKVASGLAPLVAFGVRTCFGCHDGHSTSRVKSLGKTPEELFAEKDAEPLPGC